MKRYILSKTDEEMEIEMRSHFDDLNSRLSKFARPGRTNKFAKFEDDGHYIERHSVEYFIKNYIRYFNQNVKEYGNGFETDWDDDDFLKILYKDGKIREVNPLVDEGNKKISIDNIDSIILTGGWGDAYAGPHVQIYNYRETTDYGKYGYRDVSHRYNDEDTLMLDFDV